jgi:hypothetical protein
VVALDPFNVRLVEGAADRASIGAVGAGRLDRAGVAHFGVSPVEAAALRPLDGRPDYDTSYICHRLVNREGYISYRGSRYSVPPEHAGRTLMVKEDTEGRLRVYSGERQVVEHLMAERAGSVVTAPGHPEAVRALARAGRRNGARRNGHSMLELTTSWPSWPEVQVRPLTVYDEALGLVPAGAWSWRP